MKLTKLFVIAPAVLISSFAFAQQPTYVNGSGGIAARYAVSSKAPSEPAQGTQYYIDNFNPAKVEGSNDTALIRYNAYSDELETKVNDEIMVIQPQENTVFKLVSNEAAYTYVAYKDKNNDRKQNYLVLLSDSPKVKIFKRERITLIPEQHPTGGYQKYKAPEYKKLNPEYYIQLNDGEIVYFSTKKSDVLELVPGKESEIKDFLKKNKISTSDEEDFGQLSTFLSTLL